MPLGARFSAEWSFAELPIGKQDLHAFADLLLDFAEACAFDLSDIATEVDDHERIVRFEFDVHGTVSATAFAVGHSALMGASQHAARCHRPIRTACHDQFRIQLARSLSSPTIRFRDLFGVTDPLPIEVD